MEMKTIGRIIKHTRKSRRLSLRALAERADMAHTTVREVEQGSASYYAVLKTLNALGVTWDMTDLVTQQDFELAAIFDDGSLMDSAGIIYKTRGAYLPEGTKWFERPDGQQIIVTPRGKEIELRYSDKPPKTIDADGTLPDGARIDSAYHLRLPGQPDTSGLTDEEAQLIDDYRALPRDDQRVVCTVADALRTRHYVKNENDAD